MRQQDITEDVLKELLYADDLVLLGDTWKEVESQYFDGRKH